MYLIENFKLNDTQLPIQVVVTIICYTFKIIKIEVLKFRNTKP